METMAAWTAKICVAVAAGLPCDSVDGFSMGPRGLVDSSAGGSMSLELTNWNVLDLGTGNGLFLHALLKQGYIFYLLLHLLDALNHNQLSYIH